jgi:hypothetical protein
MISKHLLRTRQHLLRPISCQHLLRPTAHHPRISPAVKYHYLTTLTSDANTAKGTFVAQEDPENTLHQLYQSLGASVTVQDLLKSLEDQGLRQNDMRIKRNVESLLLQGLHSEVAFPQFQSLIQKNNLIYLALSGRLIIPKFKEMCYKFEELADKAKEYRSPYGGNNGLGENAKV